MVVLLAAAAILIVTRQRQAGLNQGVNPTVVLALTNSDIWNVGPLTDAGQNLPDVVKYEKQIMQIKQETAQFTAGSEQGRFLISTNSLADGSRRLVIVDKVAGTFCLRDKFGKTVWAKSIGILDLGRRNDITGIGTTSNLIVIGVNYRSSSYFDLESGEFIWHVGR